jgi:hypothetical protein
MVDWLLVEPTRCLTVSSTVLCISIPSRRLSCLSAVLDTKVILRQGPISNSQRNASWHCFLYPKWRLAMRRLSTCVKYRSPSLWMTNLLGLSSISNWLIMPKIRILFSHRWKLICCIKMTHQELIHCHICLSQILLSIWCLFSGPLQMFSQKISCVGFL